MAASPLPPLNNSSPLGKLRLFEMDEQIGVDNVSGRLLGGRHFNPCWGLRGGTLPIINLTPFPNQFEASFSFINT